MKCFLKRKIKAENAFFSTTNCPAGFPAGQFFVYIRMASAYSRSVIGRIKLSMALLLIACGSKPAANTDGGAVNLYASTFTFSGGTISNNYAGDNR